MREQRGKGRPQPQHSSNNSAATQPVNEARNIRRTQQIKALHLEFEDLKKKIKDVENKNDKIIQNIHDRYDFKKKPQTAEYMGEQGQTHPPIVHYEQEGQHPSPDRGSSNPSDEDRPEQRPPRQRNASSRRQGQATFNQSMEYRRTEQNDRERSEVGSTSIKTTNPQYRPPAMHQSSQLAGGYVGGTQYSLPSAPQEVYSPQFAHQVQPQPPQPTQQQPLFHMSQQFPNNYPTSPQLAVSQAGSYYNPQPQPPQPQQPQQQQANLSQMEELRREKERVRALEGELEGREEDRTALRRIQKKYNNLFENFNQMVEGCLEQFAHEVITKKFHLVEKHVRKLENKIRKLQLRLKDQQEEYRSSRNISEMRNQRSRSRSKRRPSPKTQSLGVAPKMPAKRAVSNIVGSPPVEPSAKSKQSEVSRSSQQFEVIAGQYEEMIKTKNDEIEAYEVKLRKKDKEVAELTARIAQLQSKTQGSGQKRGASSRKASQKSEDLLITNLQLQPEKDPQVKELKKKVQTLEKSIKAKASELKEKESQILRWKNKSNDTEGKFKKLQGEIARLREDKKRNSLSQQNENQLMGKIRKLQADLTLKQEDLAAIKETCSKLEAEKIERECDNFSLTNRVKKLDGALTLKEQKIAELEKIIQSNRAEGMESLQRSAFVQKVDQSDLQALQEERDRMEEEMRGQREEIFGLKKKLQEQEEQNSELKQANESLKKEVETLQIQNESMSINLKALQFEKYKEQNRSPLQKLLEQDNAVSQQDEDHLNEELNSLKERLEEAQRALKAQNQKTFQQNKKVVKLTGEVGYLKEQLSEREEKYEKVRKEYEQNRCQVSQLQQAVVERENELEFEKKMNNEKIKELETQWAEFELEVKRQHEEKEEGLGGSLRGSRNFSEDSFVGYRSSLQSVSAENEQLREKLKQAEKVNEVHKDLEDRILNEYNSNVEKIRGELREKVRENEGLYEELESTRRKVRVLEQSESRLQELARNEDENLLGSSSSQRIVDLEMQLQEQREINNKLAAVEQQLFQQISEKELEAEQFYRTLGQRQKRIQQLQDILQMKDMNFSSHISNSQHKSKVRSSMHSMSSLRYSMLSNLPNNRDKTIELDLSEAGESFYEHNNSIISNVSEVFAREEFPYEKMNFRRADQRRLVEKTASYIKTLKNAINDKNKRIKVLEKKIESMRNSELVRTDLYELKQAEDFEAEGAEVFRDYYSVQLESSHLQRHKTKQLEHETRLTIEENNLLTNQIESLQEELLKAEEQENSLMKLKDLYKDEIRQLINKNSQQAKVFEEEVKKERQKVEHSESYQVMQSLQQIIAKIIRTFIVLEQDGPKSKKREERKRELEDCLNIGCKLLHLEAEVRDEFITALKKEPNKK